MSPEDRRPNGSPPRMRGKPPCSGGQAGAARITPAHAGKTRFTPAVYTSYTDHPRACGENMSCPSGFPAGSGSPPRMRGKRERRDRVTMQERITPAHAGKTRSTFSILATHADHPRACGENGHRQSHRDGDCGSPPRMRGKLGSRGLVVSTRRITPAHAGKTQRNAYGLVSSADHPRACGENAALRLQLRRRRGSPPRMRGKRRMATLAASRTRITPAHAGKTGHSV